MPSVTVLLPPALVALFPGSAAECSLAAATVDELLAALDTRWPGMRDRLCDAGPCVRRHIRIYADGSHATLATPLRPGAEVLIVTAISGG